MLTVLILMVVGHQKTGRKYLPPPPLSPTTSNEASIAEKIITTKQEVVPTWDENADEAQISPYVACIMRMRQIK
jgi:hypothetical protein